MAASTPNQRQTNISQGFQLFGLGIDPPLEGGATIQGRVILTIAVEGKRTGEPPGAVIGLDTETGITTTGTAPILLQTYMRDTGEVINDLSMPIIIEGRHWGAIILGLDPIFS